MGWAFLAGKALHLLAGSHVLSPELISKPLEAGGLPLLTAGGFLLRFRFARFSRFPSASP